MGLSRASAPFVPLGFVEIGAPELRAARQVTNLDGVAGGEVVAQLTLVDALSNDEIAGRDPTSSTMKACRRSRRRENIEDIVVTLPAGVDNQGFYLDVPAHVCENRTRLEGEDH